MEIMTLAIELMNRKNRLKLAAKEYFLGFTSGVTGVLAKLETLISDCARIQAVIIGQDLSNAASGIRTLDGKMDVLDGKTDLVVKQEKVQDMLDKLLKSLCIDEEDTWRDHHNTVRTQRIEGTGNRLRKEHDTFAQWYNTESNASDVMIVTGDLGRDKSFLTSAVIDHIQDPDLASGCRPPLAYSYHQATVYEDSKTLSQKESKQIGHGAAYSTGKAAIRIMGSIAWQMSKLDKDYQDLLFQTRKGEACKMDSTWIWNDLIITFPRDADINIFLRISFDPAPDLGELVPSIDDVIKVVKSELADTSIFSQKNVSNQEVQQQVLDFMSDKIQNDFPHLSLVVNEIGQCVNPRHIRRILERIDEPIEVNLVRQIRSLGSKLTSDEIKEINVLISWLESYK
ncbi:unnamed protein product [Alternaria alternata]